MRVPKTIIRKTGIGLRAPHMQELLTTSIDIGFLEAHSENYFGGGAAPKALQQLSKQYPISLHGVGLSLGRADGLDIEHLHALKKLVQAINPVFVSEHLSWSAYQHLHVPDLLPIPCTKEALSIFSRHVQQLQEALGRQILIENPSNYLAFKEMDYDEPSFLVEIVQRTGCGLLLDINNIAVSSHNLGYDAHAYLNAIPSAGYVQQMHLAGHQASTDVWIDTHGDYVAQSVWALYHLALHRFGDAPTIIEWDTDIPPLSTLCKEAAKADAIRKKFFHAAA
jgi:uncharacterized protein